MRIGILLTPYKEEQEIKQQYVKVSRRDWLSSLTDKNIITVKKKKFATDDMSIFMYLKKNFSRNHQIIPIKGDDPMIRKKIKSCDIVFLLIFDILEAYHNYTRKDFYKMKSIFQSSNVFPPYEYQDLINHKNKYYEFLRKNGINVLPFIFISRNDIKKNIKKCLRKIDGLERGDKGKIIGKPIYGQDSIDFKEFSPDTKPYKFIKYLEKISMLYTGCIFQPYRKGYDKLGEYRVFFIGDKILYCIRDKTGKRVTLKNDERLHDIYKFCEKILKILPTFTLFGKTIPKLLTRMDITCCYKNNQYFLSELEFVPSLYLDRVDGLYIDKKLGDQIIDICYFIDKIKKEEKLKNIKLKANFSKK